MSISTILAGILPVIAKLAAGMFDDRPGVKKAILIGASMAETGLEGYERFASIAEKVRKLPPGTDFTDDDLREMGVGRDVDVAAFFAMVDRKRGEAE